MAPYRPPAAPFSNEELHRMIPHLFLLRKLPTRTSDNIVQDEANLLKLLKDMVTEAHLATNGNECLQRAAKLFNTWWELQHEEILEPKQISKNIASLLPGDSFALYIREQNAGLLLSIPKDGLHDPQTAIFSTFPASCRSEDVMSRLGHLVSTCPNSSIHIPISALLQSEVLGNQLSELDRTQCDIAMPKTQKAGSLHAENRDVPDPMLISKVITALLTNNESDLCSHFPKICKKIRDQVIWEEGSKLPFRRSGLWFCAKVVLQLYLVNGLGQRDGTFLYKTIILRVLMHICKTFHHVNADISMQIIAKMAHRLCKMESYLEHNNVNKTHILLYKQLRATVLENMELARKELEIQWDETVQRDIYKARISLLHGLDFEADTEHRLYASKDYFQPAKAITAHQVPFSPPACPPRYSPSDVGTSEFPLSNFDTSGEEEVDIVLCDFEQYVRRDLESYATVHNCQDIRKLLETYTEKAKKFYADDPVGGSQMVLSVLKVIQVLDRMATETQPLFRLHKSGVEIDIVKDLLLVKSEDMKLAHDLESYFTIRNKNSYPSLIEEEQISSSSFSAIYAKKDSEMTRTRMEILTDAETKIGAKINEVQNARNYISSLRREAGQIDHTYISRTDQWGFPYQIHVSHCRKCSLEKEANNYKVEVYERPLPTDTLLQNAVVFELRIPQEIACLRDALYYFNTHICSASMSGASRPVALWISYAEISRFYEGSQQHVNLGSTTKLFKSTYYRTLHPDDYTDEEFIKVNGFNCHFVAGSGCLIRSNQATVKNRCTFSVDHDSKYEPLSWTVKNTSHSQNQVLASQTKCPKDLALSEFKEFGSLRSGHRLQLRNIYRALQQDTLSFHEESVFRLICQCVWQAGPQATPSLVCRDSHEDLADSNFATVLLELLNRVLKGQSKNWTKYYTLLTIIVLTARVLSINDEVKKKGLETLLNCRRVANDWVKKVTNVLKEMKEVSKENVEKLRLILININVCIGLTFWVDESHFPHVMRTSEDVECWLRAIAKIKDNIILNKEGVDKLRKSTLRNLLRWVRRTGVRLENHLHNMLDICGDGFSSFATDHLPDGMIGKMGPWASCEREQKQFYHCEFKSSGGQVATLHMDIIRGNFLVDGYPVGYLPSAITDHEDFQRVFSNTLFEVNPGESGSLVTKFQNCSYSFLLRDGNNLIVTETEKNDTNKYQLVPHHIFKKDIPFLLKENYSHWWNKKQKTIFFRPKSFLEPGFVNKISYKLDLDSNQLIELSSGKRFIDINSESYLKLGDIMERLEHRDHVQMLYSSEGTTVDLPRMGLQFEIDDTGHLNSREYPGMGVREQQKIGMFVGLKQGLLLENVDLSVKSNKILLMPNGNINICTKPIHQVVRIDVTELRRPEFFAFEVDEHLQDLRAGESRAGWLFLALLHAATASPIADPFTGLTGTELALRLLQSAHCWSCQPVDSASNDILKAIAKLSPVRTYYPDSMKSMEKVKWPDGLSSLAAHDAYQMIAKKLVSDSQRLASLFKETEGHPKIDYNDDLVQKSYWRHQRLYTEQGQGSPDFDLQFKSYPSHSASSVFDSNLDDNITNSVRIMAHLGWTWSVALPQPSADGYLKSLLTSERESLTGVTAVTFYPVSAVTGLTLTLKECWLNMYRFARIVKSNGYECDWTVLLCVLAFSGAPIAQLQILHAVAVHPEKFNQNNPPPYTSYVDVCENKFDSNCISTIFRQHATTLNDYIGRTNQERRYKEEEYDYERRKIIIEREHDSLVATQVGQLTSILQSKWPIKTWDASECNQSLYTEININAALMPLNSCLTKWYQNRELSLFLESVENTIFQQSVPHIVHTKVLTLSNIEPIKQCQPYRFFELSLCQLLSNNGTVSMQLLDQADMPGDHEIDQAAEWIFRTGRTHLWNLQNGVSLQSSPTPNVESFPWPTDNNCAIGQAYMDDNRRSWESYCQHPVPSVDIHSSNLLQQLHQVCTAYSNCASSMWKEAIKRVLNVTQNFSMKALMAASLFPRLIPSTVLPLICDKLVHKTVRNLFGATAVVWTLAQQANRCVRFAKAGESMEVALKKELSATENENNWSPEEKPDWLLLELEMDFKIRPIQVKVANAMLDPEEGKHALMQLNMGEGKTAVIIPLVVASLANGRQLCRVTVLKPLFHMNREALIHKLGGLLNRRVYVVPCRRDMAIGSSEASKILQIYEECIKKRGVVLALPEHRLSFQLKGYEHSRNGNFQDALPLLKVQEWLKDNARDVLDESDAILHVKYQLVYTVGEQIPVGGESLRWTVAQSLLKLVPKHLSQIMNTHCYNAAECGDVTYTPEQFPHCRLLNLDCYGELCEMLVQDILEGKLEVQFPDLQAGERHIIAKFLTTPVISEENQQTALQIVASEASTRNRDVLLILRGLLAYGVLSLVLNKRWRVNYGVHPNGHRLMAVPFRAKDVAAERTEFGHPDVAILSTILSYYYSGLSAVQLEQSFELLYRQQNCEQEYEYWVSKVRRIHPSIKNINGVNLAYSEQRENYLQPVLFKNMAVIDFWLGKVVFPKESKQFGGKMLCSPWDLCVDEAVQPVTGFSGTNDTKLLLPLNISQKDLPELLGTNGEVLHKLLLPQNNNYECLTIGTTNLDILKVLVKKNIPLLLDVGALMTEYSNKRLASTWLELLQKEKDNKKNAAIYFDKDDKLVAMDRHGRSSLFKLSPYRRRMEECVIYLDDFHTRGTDLKIPRNTKGCVTLGKGVTKDKLVQGCMRMRMLGEGHTVCFWASKEVNDDISRLTDKSEKNISTKDVLTWAMENSRLVTRDGFLHWAAAGYNYTTKKIAHGLFNASKKTDDDIRKLGEHCSDKEVIDLVRMYGTFCQEEYFPDIARSSLERQLKRFENSESGPGAPNRCLGAQNLFNEVGEKIIQQCERYIPKYKRLSHLLDEEQERELEQELEEEREVPRPPEAKPASSHLDEAVTKFIRYGTFPPNSRTSWIVKMPFALVMTKLWLHVQADGWGENIYVTKDFIKVVKIQNRKDFVDQFLRSPTWVAAVTVKNNVTIFLLLSPFEVNELMPIFRSGRAAGVLHMYAARLYHGQDTLIRCPQLQVPSSTTLASYKNFNTLNANLSIFSGNLYFADEEEQDIYTNVLGFIPRPRSKEEQKVFDNGQTSNGFVKPEFRKHLPSICSKFQKNPEPLVRGIIATRFDYLSSRCHISRLIMDLRKPFSEEEAISNADDDIDLFDEIFAEYDLSG